MHAKRLLVAIVCLLLLGSCTQGGYLPSYIISTPEGSLPTDELRPSPESWNVD